MKTDMDRKKITKFLSECLEQYINPDDDPRVYWAKEVTFTPTRPPEGYTISKLVNGKIQTQPSHIRVDYMVCKPLNNTTSGIERSDFYCYEVKSCPEDFHSGHGLNFIGDFNYLVMTDDTYDAVRDEIPWHVGVLIPTEEDGSYNPRPLRSIKKATRMDRQRSVSEMLLMMFRSAARDKNSVTHG